MSIKNIDRNEWQDFMDSFNSNHENWYSSIKEIENREERVLLKNFRLKEIGLDLEKGEYNNVAYINGQKENEEINHVVMKIKNISIEEDEEGNDKTIFFESESGKTTAIKFRTSQPDERLNGLVK